MGSASLPSPNIFNQTSCVSILDPCEPLVYTSSIPNNSNTFPSLPPQPLSTSHPLPIPHVNPLNYHSMITRAKNNIITPSKKLTMNATTLIDPITEPNCVSQALKDPRWHQAMSEEFDALFRNGTWDLVPRSAHQNIVGCK